MGRQYLGSIGKVDSGVVSVHSLWADERLYYPIEFEPYTPKHWFEQGDKDPQFRSKPKIALELVQQAMAGGIPFRVVVADAFYGENHPFKDSLQAEKIPYVLALNPSHAWWHFEGDIGSVEEVALASPWQEDKPGAWLKVTRSFRDGHKEDWWVLDGIAGPYGPKKPQRLVIATTDPATLPELTTWYLLTNLPAPRSKRAEASVAPADLAEVVRLYSLRVWVEQSYKQVKGHLGWAEYQVRKDIAMRRHWQLVCCAFSFCWWALAHEGQELDLDRSLQPTMDDTTGAKEGIEDEGEKRTARKPTLSWPEALRRVRAWLEPYLMLTRYWQAWSTLPPPQQLQRLLDWLFEGRPIYLYVR